MQTLTLWQTLGLFGLSALVIGFAGVAMTKRVDILADRTGLGEAIVGGIVLGAATSLSGVVTSMTAAWNGDANLSFSNAVGGIAAQTAFLCIADLTYRRTNLEHAAASAVNLVQASLLILLLSLPLMAALTHNWSVFHIHPISFVLFGVYWAGQFLSRQTRESPMWRPHETPETRADVADTASKNGPSTALLVLQFCALALLTACAGWVVAKTGSRIVATTGLSSGVVGALMTAVATSLPELVTTISAVRRGALQLAVGGIIGGNTFDVLFLSLSDITYRPGSLYHSIDLKELFWLVLGIVMTAILLLGLIQRDKKGVGGIGFESALILLLYVAAIVYRSVSP